MIAGERDLLLRTLGHPELIGPGGVPVRGLRRKDLALLAYLCVEGSRPHSRGRLAALLWGGTLERRARHSLTQALGRVLRAAGRDTLVLEGDTVRFTGTLACDAEWLRAGDGERLDPLLTLYGGPFLDAFEAGFGSEDFGHWADRRRVELRDAGLRWLETAGAAAEAAGDWPQALRIGERGAEIDDMHEEARRRVLRALLELGERNRALRYYEEFARFLAKEVGSEPDPDTTALYERVRDSVAASAPPPATPPPLPPPSPEPPPAPPEPPAATQPSAEPEAPPEVAPAAQDGPGDPPPAAEPGETSAAPSDDGRATDRSQCVVCWMAAGALTLVLIQAALAMLFGPPRPPAPPLPRHGEAIRAAKGGPVYLAYGDTLWRYPDAATLHRCLGGWPKRIRRVPALPDWPRRTLASVAEHPWQGGTKAVITDHPQHPTQHVAVGCVLAPVPNPRTFREIFGHTDSTRSHHAPDPVLRASPRTAQALGYPVRPAGTLIRDGDHEVKWIAFHGGALATTPPVLATYCRSPADAVQVSAAEFAYYRTYAALPPAAGPCRK